MRIYYHCSDYVSYRRAGEAYKACLRRLGHELADSPDGCRLVILHESPHKYPQLFTDMPRQPGVTYVGYGVWETPQLPRLFQEGVRLVDALWTCSEFSRAAFAPYCRAFCLPHVVERPRTSREALARMARRLGLPPAGGPRPFLFYTIVDTVNPRKDLPTLLGAFAVAFPDGDGTVRLAVKQYREPQDLSAFPFVIDIPEMLDDADMAALHALGDAYVSAHHAEAWGLPLSEALSFGKTVIATGYSGNMEFMDAANSLPVPYRIAGVGQKMVESLPQLFSADMTWAEIDAPALVRALRLARSSPGGVHDRAAVAASMRRFSAEATAGRLRSLLAALGLG